MTLFEQLQQPEQSDWKPKPGDKVIVPSVSFGKKAAYSATVETVLDDIVRVRVPYFRWGRQEFLLGQIRPLK